MTVYTDTIVDDSGYRRPVAGAAVYLFNQDGSLAAASPNPTTSDEFGGYRFDIADDVYAVEGRLAGVTLFRESIVVGDPPQYHSTIPGPADNTYSDLAAFRASDITRATASLVSITGLPDGRFNWTLGNYTGQADDLNIIKAESTALSVGAWVRQRDDGVQSRRSTQWAIRDVSKRLNDSIPHFFDVNGLSDAEKVKIKNQTTTADVTGLLTSAMALAAAEKSFLHATGLLLTSGEGAQFANNSGIIGDGRGNTIIRKTDPTQPYAVTGSSVRNILLRGLTVDGARTAPGMYVNSNFSVYANNVVGMRMEDCDIIGARGDGFTFEYGAGLRVTRCTFRDNDKDGLYTPGATVVRVNDSEAIGNNLAGFAFSATRYLQVGNCYSAGNTQAELLLSRDTLNFEVSDTQLGDEYYGMAQFALYVLGEPIGNNETLHKRPDGTGGINYPVTSDMSARKGSFANVACYGAVSLELLNQATFDAACTYAKSGSLAVSMLGCSDVHFEGPTAVDYVSGTGFGLFNSAKNGGVPNARNTITRGKWIKPGAPDSFSRISDFAGVGGLRETDSIFNGVDAMFGSADVTIPALAAGAYDEVGDIFVPLIKIGDAIERASFSVDTAGIDLSYRVTATNTVKLIAHNYSGAGTPAIPGTARIWYARK